MNLDVYIVFFRKNFDRFKVNLKVIDKLEELLYKLIYNEEYIREINKYIKIVKKSKIIG